MDRRRIEKRPPGNTAWHHELNSLINDSDSLHWPLQGFAEKLIDNSRCRRLRSHWRWMEEPNCLNQRSLPQHDHMCSFCTLCVLLTPRNRLVQQQPGAASAAFRPNQFVES